jgi:hypothetical protein
LPPKEAYLRALHTYAATIGKPIAGEKTPLNEFYLDLLDEWLAEYDLKFVHMVRHPLDVASSYKKLPYYRGKVGESVSLVSTVAHNWSRSVAIGLARARARPHNHLVVQFESLTGDPAASANRIAQFIGVAFEEERMLGFADYKNTRDNTSDPENRGEGTTHRVYKPADRTHDLSAAEVAAVADACGELAWALGYRNPEFLPSPPLPPPRPDVKLKAQDALRKLGFGRERR